MTLLQLSLFPTCRFLHSHPPATVARRWVSRQACLGLKQESNVTGCRLGFSWLIYRSCYCDLPRRLPAHCLPATFRHWQSNLGQADSSEAQAGVIQGNFESIMTGLISSLQPASLVLSRPANSPSKPLGAARGRNRMSKKIFETIIITIRPTQKAKKSTTSLLSRSYSG